MSNHLDECDSRGNEDVYCHELGEEHEWGDVQLSRLSGTPHRACVKCFAISLDLSGDEKENEDV